MEDIKLLKEDHHYYGDVGRKYLSNSDLGTLLNNPKMFGVSRPDNKNFAEGRYFHQCILEAEKSKSSPTLMLRVVTPRLTRRGLRRQARR